MLGEIGPTMIFKKPLFWLYIAYVCLFSLFVGLHLHAMRDSSLERLKMAPIEVPEHIEVSPGIYPTFYRLVELCQRNGVEIDYSKVSAIKIQDTVMAVDNKVTTPFGTTTIYKQVAGVYYIDTGVIKIGRYRVIEPENEKDYFLWVLAHELGHSQGIEHIQFDPLMSRSTGAYYFLEKTSNHNLEKEIVKSLKNNKPYGILRFP
jgi:hypothetical protein